MRTTKLLLVAWAALALAGAALAGETKANAAWERMKKLQGDWEGTYGGKEPVKVSYRLVSNGTALMETMSAPGEMEMVTVYHPDGERLMMTHYCSEGNQPRMRDEGGGADANKLVFSFVDATNHASPDQLVMRKLVVAFQDPDHFTQEWTSRGKGKEETGRFAYARKK